MFDGIINWVKSIKSVFKKAEGSESPLQASVPEGVVSASPVTTDDSFDASRLVSDYSVTEKWHRGWKRGLSEITEAVVHHTAGGGNINSLKSWMLAGERQESYKQGIGLFHFSIDADGAIWKVGPISRWWFHSSCGQHDRLTVGIELIHKSGPFAEKQYESLFWMLFEYLPHFCQNYNRIVSHDYNFNTYSNNRKGCPGPDFSWARLEDEMKKREISYRTHGFEEYAITFPGVLFKNDTGSKE